MPNVRPVPESLQVRRTLCSAATLKSNAALIPSRFRGLSDHRAVRPAGTMRKGHCDGCNVGMVHHPGQSAVGATRDIDTAHFPPRTLARECPMDTQPGRQLARLLEARCPPRFSRTFPGIGCARGTTTRPIKDLAWKPEGQRHFRQSAKLRRQVRDFGKDGLFRTREGSRRLRPPADVALCRHRPARSSKAASQQAMHWPATGKKKS